MKRNRKVGTLIALMLVLIVSVQTVFAGNIATNAANWMLGSEQKVAVKLDGKIITFPDTQPYVDENDRTLVPFQGIL